jgi:hypothetical protein
MREDELRRHVEAAKVSLERASQALDLGDTHAQVGVDAAREQLRFLRRRNAAFPAGLFGDYRWPMLLVLYVAHEEQREVRQIDAFRDAGVPHTTGKRIIDELVDLNLVEVRPGGSGQAKRFAQLSPGGQDQKKRFFSGAAPDHCAPD